MIGSNPKSQGYAVHWMLPHHGRLACNPRSAARQRSSKAHAEVTCKLCRRFIALGQ